MYMQRQNVMARCPFRRVSAVSDAVREQPDDLAASPAYG
jgi:hypothetical protein